MARRLALPSSVSQVHNVFQVSIEKVPDPSHVIDFGEIEVASHVTYEERLARKLEYRTK